MLESCAVKIRQALRLATLRRSHSAHGARKPLGNPTAMGKCVSGRSPRLEQPNREKRFAIAKKGSRQQQRQQTTLFEGAAPIHSGTRRPCLQTLPDSFRSDCRSEIESRYHLTSPFCRTAFQPRLQLDLREPVWRVSLNHFPRCTLEWHAVQRVMRFCSESSPDWLRNSLW
jgi:hypothetical protein